MAIVVAVVLWCAALKGLKDDSDAAAELAEEHFDFYHVRKANVDTRALLAVLNAEPRRTNVVRHELKLIGPADGHVFNEMSFEWAGIEGHEQHDFFLAMMVPAAMIDDEGEGSLVIKRLLVDGIEAVNEFDILNTQISALRGRLLDHDEHFLQVTLSGQKHLAVSRPIRVRKQPSLECTAGKFPVLVRDAPSSPCQSAESVVSLHCGHNENMAVTRRGVPLLVLELEKLFGSAVPGRPTVSYESEVEFASAWHRALAAADAHVDIDLYGLLDAGVIIGDRQCPLVVPGRSSTHEKDTQEYGFPFHVFRNMLQVPLGVNTAKAWFTIELGPMAGQELDDAKSPLVTRTSCFHRITFRAGCDLLI